MIRRGLQVFFEVPPRAIVLPLEEPRVGRAEAGFVGVGTGLRILEETFVLLGGQLIAAVAGKTVGGVDLLRGNAPARPPRGPPRILSFLRAGGTGPTPGRRNHSEDDRGRPPSASRRSPRGDEGHGSFSLDVGCRNVPMRI